MNRHPSSRTGSLFGPRRALATLCVASMTLASCANFQVASRQESALPSGAPSPAGPFIAEQEQVDTELTKEIDEILLALQSPYDSVAMAAQTRAEILASDLDAGIMLLTMMRSPRAGSVAAERARLPASLAGARPRNDGQPAIQDSWGGSNLARWTNAILRWELLREIDHEAFTDTGCTPPTIPPAPANQARGRQLPPWHNAALNLRNSKNTSLAEETGSSADESSGDGAYEVDPRSLSNLIDAPPTPPAVDFSAYGHCIIERTASAWQQADGRLDATLRAAFGDIEQNALQWLKRRSLPVDDHGMLGADDVSLRSASAWTGKPASNDVVSANGVVVSVRSTGVYVSTRPALLGSAVLEGTRTTCAWPGEKIVVFTGLTTTLPLAAWTSGLRAMMSTIERCELEVTNAARDSVRVAIDSGVRWYLVQPVLRRLVSQQRAPVTVVHQARGGAMSLLPIAMVADVRGDTCGVEAHLRHDGVVLRGGGSPTTLLSWAERDAFEKITKAGVDTAARCGADGVARVYVDDPNVDWGLIVRTLERLSWPQVCAMEPCLLTRLIVGTDS